MVGAVDVRGRPGCVGGGSFGQVGADGRVALQDKQRGPSEALQMYRSILGTPLFSEERMNEDLCSAGLVDLVDLEVSQDTSGFFEHWKATWIGSLQSSETVHLSSTSVVAGHGHRKGKGRKCCLHGTGG